MTNRELLEAAARAACFDYECTSHTGYQQNDQHQIRAESGQLLDWNPLTDDGDALRLAVKLEFGIAVFSAFVEVTDGLRIAASERTEADPVAATRRAIVRAAAEIGSLHNVCGMRARSDPP